MAGMVSTAAVIASGRITLPPIASRRRHHSRVRSREVQTRDPMTAMAAGETTAETVADATTIPVPAAINNEEAIAGLRTDAMIAMGATAGANNVLRILMMAAQQGAEGEAMETEGTEGCIVMTCCEEGRGEDVVVAEVVTDSLSAFPDRDRNTAVMLPHLYLKNQLARC